MVHKRKIWFNAAKQAPALASFCLGAFDNYSCLVGVFQFDLFTRVECKWQSLIYIQNRSITRVYLAKHLKNFCF